jgi:hypothetical protein
MPPVRKPAMTMAEFAAGITDLGDSIPSVNILIYGDPGCGKTGVAGGLPDSLLLACDPGYLTAKRLGYKCSFSKITSMERLEAALNWLEDGGAENYRWVTLDGMSVLYARLLQEAARQAWEENPAKRVSAVQPDKPDYFRAQNAVKSAVARLMDLPCNVMLTAHAAHGEDDEGETWVRPHIEGRGYMVGNAVCALPNAIGYMYPGIIEFGTGKNRSKKQTRRIRWETTRHPETDVIYLAKDQTGALAPITDDISGVQLDKAVTK